MAKCDTNPLTKAKHMYYIHSRLASYPPQGQGGTTTQGEHHPRPPRTQRPSPSQRAARYAAPTAQAKAAISSPKGPGSPFPQPSGDGRSINSKQHVGVRDQPTRRTIHPERSSQRYAHSPAKYNSPPMQGLLRAIEPLWDSTVVTIGQFRSVDDGSGFVLPFIRMVEPSVLWTRTPHLSRPPAVKTRGVIAGWPPAPAQESRTFHRLPPNNQTKPKPQSKIEHRPLEGPPQEDLITPSP